MSAYEAFYRETLYPLQNGVLSALARSGTPFWLTGGTALHRHYFRERYSDDLDLFVTRDDRFAENVKRALAALEQGGYRLDEDALRSPDFVRVTVRTATAALRLDFVNDATSRFGDLTSGDLFPRIDALRNILSNKVTAVFRMEPKDFADLRTIARSVAFDWSDVLAEAGKKQLGLEAAEIATLIRAFPPERMDSIRWREAPDRDRFRADLACIAEDMFAARPNSLAPGT